MIAQLGNICRQRKVAKELSVNNLSNCRHPNKVNNTLFDAGVSRLFWERLRNNLTNIRIGYCRTTPKECLVLTNLGSWGEKLDKMSGFVESRIRLTCSPKCSLGAIYFKKPIYGSDNVVFCVCLSANIFFGYFHDC
jgi:hypothetical protein